MTSYIKDLETKWRAVETRVNLSFLNSVQNGLFKFIETSFWQSMNIHLQVVITLTAILLTQPCLKVTISCKVIDNSLIISVLRNPVQFQVGINGVMTCFVLLYVEPWVCTWSRGHLSFTRMTLMNKSILTKLQCINGLRVRILVEIKKSPLQSIQRAVSMIV